MDNPPEDPRGINNKYTKAGASAKFDKEKFEFLLTQFLIDDNYVGDPPNVQVSIDNLNDNIDENFLRKELTKLGKIRTLEIIRHPQTGQHLGLAKVQFEKVSVAHACIESFHEKNLMGRKLQAFMDLRFTIIEKLKETKLNPKPIVTQKPSPSIAPPNLPLASLHHPNLNTHQTILPLHVPSPEATTRGRLDDRIAILMKQKNCVLSTIVAPVPPQASPTPTYSAFNIGETNYLGASYYHHQQNLPHLKTNDRQRPETNNHSNHYQNHRESHHKQDSNYLNNYTSFSDKHSDHNSNDSWNNIPERSPPETFNIELTEEQIQDVVLPYAFKEFYHELTSNLLNTIFKKIRERYGYQCLEDAQTSYKAKQDELKVNRDRERLKREQQRQFERRFMSKSRIEQRQTEAPRPRVNLIRQRTNDYSSMQDTRLRRDDPDLRRVNRSSAYMAEERRGSHNTIDDDSDSESTSSRSSSSSGSSSISTSSSSSSSSISSSASSLSSNLSSSSSHSFQEFVQQKPDVPAQINRIEQQTSNNDDELMAASALLGLATETDDSKQARPQTTGKKRKKNFTEPMGVASEYRATKKFAADPAGENIENAMIEDEEVIEEKLRYTYPPRSEEEKQRMLDELYDSLSDEDLKYLAIIHEEEGIKEMGFGSENANKAHLNAKKHMIEGKAAEGHPKWWRGCSRCDVIEVSEKEKIGYEELDYEDLIKAPIKSHVIPRESTSTRREPKGDQRRIAAANANLDPELLEFFNLNNNTLANRSKNLRFSRSKIHKWGLFACEKISNGEAVIEYIGEKIRPSLADHREKVVYTNLPTHDGSSYFFRVESEVIDATLKGNKARFINHSCNPNCIAKVIKLDAVKSKILIYAKQAIEEDEEITYDYKFPREETGKIRCNCRAPNCQKFLN